MTNDINHWNESSEVLPQLIDVSGHKISLHVLGFGNEDMSRFETYHIVRLHGDNKFYTPEGMQMRITHWMPLPTMPEEYRR